jgi:1-pyrroline-5-carboxylate dehydrogenase
MQTKRQIEEFRNEPFTDFSDPNAEKAMCEAIEKTRSELGKEYKCKIGSEYITLSTKFESRNPSRKEEVIGIFSEVDSDTSLVERAISAAEEAFQKWKFVPAVERAEYLFKIADLMRKRKHELSALMVLEVSKTWPEADADTAEAIDFMEFYAREAIRWAEEQPLVRIPSEKNSLEYIPLGVGAIIPPWNFPLAIMSGMTMAAVVAGNTVVLKPSSDSPTIAAKFIEITEEAGLPHGVINFLTGSAATGEAMVQHPKTRFISFTGSKGVGLHINEEAAKTRPGQIWIKRVIAEMGGKDAIIVADDADLDAAALGVVQSAFGFQGQKCSACSRLIVDESVHSQLMEKVLSLTSNLKIGDPTDPTTNLAAVINKRAFDKTLKYIRIGQDEGGKLLTGGKGDDSVGYFIEPTIIDGVKPGQTIEQEEIFAPVLAVIKVKNYDEALQVANDTEFGLTGAVYSKSQDKLNRARKEFHVGNLYLNRKCTGALVGVHPFGGFNMSGTDSKAGGREYLLQYMQAKAISEKI